MSQDPVIEVLQSLVERMDHLEASVRLPSISKEPTRKQVAQLCATSVGRKDILLEDVLLTADQDQRETRCPQRRGTGD